MQDIQVSVGGFIAFFVLLGLAGAVLTGLGALVAAALDAARGRRTGRAPTASRPRSAVRVREPAPPARPAEVSTPRVPRMKSRTLSSPARHTRRITEGGWVEDFDGDAGVRRRRRIVATYEEVDPHDEWVQNIDRRWQEQQGRER